VPGGVGNGRHVRSDLRTTGPRRTGGPPA
jgi:hypothetical protein